jgi:hypothetical protein
VLAVWIGSERDQQLANGAPCGLLIDGRRTDDL